MIERAPSYHGYRFPPDVIAHPVWLFFRFSLSFREVEDLLAQRGITVTYDTVDPRKESRTNTAPEPSAASRNAVTGGGTRP